MAESSVHAGASPSRWRIRPDGLGRYDGCVTEPTADAPRTQPRTEPRTEPSSEPPRIPGERRLAHPPSDRFRASEPPAPVEDPAATPVRGVASGIVAAAIGAAAIVLLGGVLAVSSGLVVVAGATGWAVASALRAGAAHRLGIRSRVRLAMGLALLAVILGQVGLWAYARSEGGVLGPLDYLAETFGVLVPLELFVAWIVAWATAR